jgi:hypothetical protein
LGGSISDDWAESIPAERAVKIWNRRA